MQAREKYKMVISLDTIYVQTQEWMKEITFFQEELPFLKERIQDKVVNNTTEGQDHKKIYMNIDCMLIKLSVEMKAILSAHESHLLGAMSQNEIGPINQCIKDYADCLHKISSVKKGIKDLKRSIFNYLEDNPQNELNEILPDY